MIVARIELPLWRMDLKDLLDAYNKIEDEDGLELFAKELRQIAKERAVIQ
jgi:hypothetical protein